MTQNQCKIRCSIANQNIAKNATANQNDAQESNGASLKRGIAIWTLNLALVAGFGPKVLESLQRHSGAEQSARQPLQPMQPQEQQQRLDPDIIACQQFLDSRSALKQFESSPAYDQLTRNLVFNPAKRGLHDPARRQLDDALEAASSTYNFTQPPITTRDRLRAFQRAHDLKDDGVCGANTKKALAEALYGKSDSTLQNFADNNTFLELNRAPAFNPDKDPSAPASIQLSQLLERLRHSYVDQMETHTAARLQAFQAAHEIKANGVFGPSSRFYLAKAIFPEPELVDSAAKRFGLQQGGLEAFEGFIDHLIEREGGVGAVEKLKSANPTVRASLLVNDPNDPGKETFCGITLLDYQRRMNPQASVRDLTSLTLEDVRQYYFHEYFQKLHLAELPASIAYICSDAAVNHGTGKLGEFCQTFGLPQMKTLPQGALSYVQRTALESGGAEQLIIDLFEQRVGMYEACSSRLRANFMDGWLNRLSGINSLLSAQGCYGEDCSNRIEAAIDTARVKEQRRRKS